MEVEHFSHPDHPLILINQVLEYSCELVICSGCEGPIWGPGYSCTSCYFFLHKKCADLPREIKRRIHRRHPLHLLAKSPYKGKYSCDRCYKTFNSFVYHCSFCKFDLDIKCAFQPGFFDVDSHAHQFAHKDHPLILNEEKECHDEGVMCSVCKEPMSAPSYSCTSCNVFLHKKCAELPPEINRHLHPEHPLRLLPNHDMICGFCNETCYDSFVYCCFVCEFDLHIKCTFPPCVYAADQDQGHQFRRLMNPLSLKSISFTCNACGTDGDDSPFGCTMCQLVVHEECVSLPLTLKTALHHHPQIIHTFHPQQCIKSIKKHCGICCREVDSKYGVYYCPDCDFVAHVNCSREYGDSATEIVEENEEEQSVTVDDQFMEPSFRVVREIKHGEERIIEEIKHFCHQHNLILSDKVDDDLKCDGCMLPISTPFYSCASCNFFLDKTCIELPRRKKWHYHENQMILSWNQLEHDLFYCDVCKQFFRGLRYACDVCELWIDVRCFKSLEDSFKHGGHEHPLYLPADRKNILRCNIGGRWPPPWAADDRENIPHCNGCCVSEESNVFFKCVVCDFKLGMKCATLPYKARHEYDDHPLFLTYINENDYQPSCIICEEDRDPKLWFYRCEECDFDAHPECALGKYPYIKLGGVQTYPKHPHPLALVIKTEDYRPQACDSCGEPCDDLALECTDPNCSFIVHRKSCELVICSGCDGPIWGLCYNCTSGYFFLHKKCADLPREIKRRIHRRHPLHLLAKSPYKGKYSCDRCYKTFNSFVYHCSFCKFDLDIKCAFQLGFFDVDSQAHQFAHKDHPLILNEEKEYHDEGVMCSVCKEPMSAPSYSCTSCNFFLHKTCAELPPEIKRHLHPEHPLRLLPNHDTMCDFCNETCYESFVYCCFVCEFNLHIKCAFPPCVYAADQDQRHRFRRLLNPLSFKSISFTCNACGTEGDDSPFMCTMCHLVVHEECVSLPLTLKTALHHHPQIIHTFHPQQCIKSIKKHCGICCREVDSKYGVYYCPDCDFVAHVNCSREYGDSATEIVEENEEEQSVTVDDQFMEPSFRVVREIKDGEERIIEEIEHFSHQHNLILIDKVDDDLKCDGCMLSISTPFYSCASCNFFLDKTCIELPRRKKWQYHENQLILSWNRGSHHLYKCDVCNQDFRGLRYTCAICGLCIDVRCFKSILKDSFKHGGHEHPLYLPASRKNILRCNIGGRGLPPWVAVADDRENIPHCGGCFVGEESKVFFKCAVCDFKLGMKCATLPYKARHEYDDHPLFLTYINENDYQPSCIICEEDRDPKLWFYRCEECDFDAHPECALGKYPYVKPGGLRTYRKHPHPLALVLKTEDYPACDTCGEPCDDLALECTDPNCSFIVHYKRWECFESLW